jgi:hypothetical protein
MDHLPDVARLVQIRTRRSAPEDARLAPSGLQATDKVGPVCAGIVNTSAPSDGSQSLMVPSAPAVASLEISYAVLKGSDGRCIGASSRFQGRVFWCGLGRRRLPPTPVSHGGARGRVFYAVNPHRLVQALASLRGARIQRGIVSGMGSSSQDGTRLDGQSRRPLPLP